MYMSKYDTSPDNRRFSSNVCTAPYRFHDARRDMMCSVYSARPPRKYRVFLDH